VSQYLNPQETDLVINMVSNVAPKVMIEIGCQLGETAKVILEQVHTLERYIGIDVPFRHKTRLTGQQHEVPANAGLYAEDDPRFYLLLCDSTKLMPSDLEPCDAVFIDGDHSARAVMHDSRLAKALVRPGGIIIWHDMHNEAVEVTPVIKELCAEGWPIMYIENTWLAFCRIGNSHANETE
jgi:predicted O-methyltransferase YrrM